MNIFSSILLDSSLKNAPNHSFYEDNKALFTALLIFILGQLAVLVREWYLKRNLQYNKLIYLSMLVKNCTNSTVNNIINFKNTAELLKKSNGNFPMLNYSSHKDIARVVEKLNLEEYYLAYITLIGSSKANIENYRTIIQALDEQQELYSEMFKETDKAFKNDAERVIEAGKQAKNIEELIYNLFTTIYYPSLTNELKEKISQLKDNYNKNKIFDNYQVYMSEYLKPIQDILIQFEKEIINTKLSDDIFKIDYQIYQLEQSVEIIFLGIQEYHKRLVIYINRFEGNTTALSYNSKDLIQFPRMKKNIFRQMYSEIKKPFRLFNRK